MQFWPFAVLILGSGLFALSTIVVMMRVQQPHPKGISPHHRWNRKTDALIACEAQAARSNR